MKTINDSLNRMAMRLRCARALRGSAIGGLAGAFAATVFAILDQTGALYSSWQLLGGCFLVFALVGAIVGFLFRVDKAILADSVDRRLGLQDRLRTSLEEGDSDFHRAVVSDTENVLELAGKRNAFPLRLSRWHAAAVLCMALACGIFLLGNSPIFLSDADRKEREDLMRHAEQIRKVAKPVLDRPEDTSAEERELAERLERLANDLEKGRMSKKEAIAEANKLSERAEELAKERNAKAERAMTTAEALRKQADKNKLEAAGLKDVDMSQVEQSNEELQRAEASLTGQISDLERKLSEDGLSQSDRSAMEKQLADATEQLEQIKLSQKAKEFLERLQSHPAYKELLEMAKKINESAKEGGKKQLTKEEIDKMIKQLEELADKLKDDEDMRRFIEEMMKALKECEGACSGLGMGLGLFGLLPGSGRSQDNFFGDTGRINTNEEEQDIAAIAKEHAVRGERGEQGKETHIEVMGPSASGERTKTPYTSVLPRYKRSAESAINRQQIPKSQQKRVREYFDSLAGGK